MDASVIIPALNARGTIERAVRSAADQTLQTIEVVVVDDGSNDGTAEIVAGLGRADPRIKLIRHPARQGVSAARNSAIRAASGEWLAVLDADDWFAPDRLATLVERGRVDDLDAVIDNLSVVDARTGEVLGHAFPDALMTSAQHMAPSLPVAFDIPYRQGMGFGYCKPVFRKATFVDRVGGYDERFRCAEDLLALQLLLLRGGSVGTADSAGYYYSVNPISLSNRPGAAIDVSAVNTLLLREAEKRDMRSVVSLLRKRQVVIDYDAFAKLAQQRDLKAAARFLQRVPVSVLASQILRIAGRRFGVDLDRLDPRDLRWRERVTGVERL